MLVQATFVTLIIVYLRKVYRPLVLTDKGVICMIIYLGVFNIFNSVSKTKLYWIILLEEVIFRGALLQDVANTELNNTLASLVFAFYQMIYIKDLGIFIVAFFTSYLLCLGSRKMSVYELAMLRTLFYLCLW
jgi:membrane protease YdiL (CAAX protease family)